MESFSHFLTWMRDHLVNPEIDPGQAVPRGIVVDPHDGQYPAIQDVFPQSGVIFRAEQLAANIQGRWNVTDWSITSIGK
jgi:hypothetical protein